MIERFEDRADQAVRGDGDGEPSRATATPIECLASALGMPVQDLAANLLKTGAQSGRLDDEEAGFPGVPGEEEKELFDGEPDLRHWVVVFRSRLLHHCGHAIA